MKRKFSLPVSILLVALMIASVLSGCGTKTIKSVTVPKDEKVDLKGYEVKIALAAYDPSPQKSSPTYKEQMQQVQDLQKKYNCKIKFIMLPDCSPGVSQFVTSTLAGDPVGDFAMFDSAWAYPQIIVKNTCLPLDNYFDLNAEWINKEVTKLGEYKGKHYIFGFAKFTVASGVYFNKRIFEKDQLPDLYELQKNKQWTWDKLLEIAKKETKDLNGDGKTEQWGLCSTDWFIVSQVDDVICSNGGRITRTKDGMVKFTMDEPEVIEALQFLYDLNNSYKVVDPVSWGLKDFLAGKVAMASGNFGLVNIANGDMKEDKYGYVLYPLGPHGTDYVSTLADIGVNVLPVSSKHPKEVAKLLTDYYGPHPWDVDNKVGYEAAACDEQTADVCLEGEKKMIIQDFLSYPFIRDNIWSGFPRFITGSQSAKAWVESIKTAAQKSIDDVWSAVN